MRIPEYIISDLKDLGINHLMALGFGLTGFSVAYGVNKTCQWFFQLRDADQKETMRSRFVEILAMGLGLEACFFLAHKDRMGNSSAVNPRVLVAHIAAFALASFTDPKKIVRAGIGLSAASVCLNPIYMGAAGTCFGGWEPN